MQHQTHRSSGTTAPKSPPTDPSANPQRPRAFLATVSAVQFMAVLDASIVNVALPGISDSLDLRGEALSLVVSVYTLVFGALLLLGGRLGDRYPRRQIFVIGVSVFALASLVAGAATTGPVLIGARALQGAAAAVMAPNALALLTTGFPEGPARTKALGTFGAVSAVGFSAGVLVGGLLVQLLGWRSVFLINVPIAIAIVLIARITVPRRAGTSARIDLPGAVTATIGSAALVYLLSTGPSAGWTAPPTLTAAALAVAAVASFVLIESRSAAPLVRLGLLRNISLSGANAIVLLFGATLLPVLFLMTLHLQGPLALPPLLTGLVLLPHAVLVILLAPLVTRLTSHTGPWPPLAIGSAVMAGGTLLLSRTPQSGPSAVLLALLGTALVGAGLSAAIVAGSVAATSGVDDHEQGMASGLYTTSQQLGGALGLALIVPLASGATLQTPLLAATVLPTAAILIAVGVGISRAGSKEPAASS